MYARGDDRGPDQLNGTDQPATKAAELLVRFRSGMLSDDELSEIAVALDSLLPDPHWFSYTVDHEPELSAEEIVAKAFAYRPIEL